MRAARVERRGGQRGVAAVQQAGGRVVPARARARAVQRQQLLAAAVRAVARRRVLRALPRVRVAARAVHRRHRLQAGVRARPRLALAPRLILHLQ